MSELTDEDRALLQKLLSKPLLIPGEFRGWLQQYASLHAMPQIMELAGYRTRRWRVATPISTFEEGSSVGIGSADQDLATVGPQLVDLEDGTYASLWGMYSKDGTANTRLCRLNYNDGAAFSDFASVTIEGMTVGVDIKSLKNNGRNKIKMRYATATSNANYFDGLRWLASVRVA